MLTLAALLSTVAHAATLHAMDPSSDSLVTVDTGSGVVTPVGPLFFDFDFGGAAYDATAGRLYVAPGRTDSNLYRVDPVTGFGTLIGYHGVPDLFSLAYDDNTGLLMGYSAATYQAYIMNTSTGAATPAFSIGFYAGGCDFSASIGGIVCQAAGPGDWYFEASGSMTSSFYAPTAGFINNGSTAQDPATGLFWSVDWSAQLISYDPATSMSIVSAGYTSGYALDGAEFLAAGPPPTFSLARTAGTCPGPATYTATAGSGGNIAFVYGGIGGSTTVPSGPCAGTVVPLRRAKLIRMVAAPSGSASVSGTVPAAACTTQNLAAVDMNTCTVSNIITP